MKYCIYAYVFDDGMTYIGLTCNPHKRHLQHSREEKSCVFRYSVSSKLPIPEMTILTDFMPGEEAQQAEHDHLCAVPEKFRLNIGPTGKGTGSLGWTAKKMTPEKIKEWFRNYWATHKEQLSAAGKIYYQAHREERLEYQRKYRTGNKEKVQARKREYYRRNKDRLAEKQKANYRKRKALGLIKKHVGPQPYNPEYYRKNKDKFMARKRKWKARCKLRKIFGQPQVKLLTYNKQEGEQ